MAHQWQSPASGGINHEVRFSFLLGAEYTSGSKSEQIGSQLLGDWIRPINRQSPASGGINH